MVPVVIVFYSMTLEIYCWTREIGKIAKEIKESTGDLPF
jgi:hypothetical protein